MNAQHGEDERGRARAPRAIPAGVRKIPTPTVPPTTSAAAAPRPMPALEPPEPPGRSELGLRPSWKARGPPEPKTPPAVVSARPNEDERRKPGSDGSELSRASTFA